jgi:hypothetical protein
VIEAFARSIDTVFLAGVPIAVIGFAISLLLREDPLRSTEAGPEAVMEVAAEDARVSSPG